MPSRTERPRRVAVLGPTASGKSALGVAVARHLGGTVVNGDPFQALEGIAIGTGQPSPEEQGGVPHVGYGCLPLAEPLNPAGFGAQVRSWMDPLPCAVLVTGSGLYLRGIWNQLDALPPVPESLVLQIRQRLAEEGAPALHRELMMIDPVRASELHPNDGSRIQRALALHLATGQRPSELLKGTLRGIPEGWQAVLVLPSRERQRERVARRVHAMVEQGWPAEVQRIVDKGGEDDLRRVRPLGYLHWLEGGDPVIIERAIVQETLAYAKRQSTWFRHQLPGVTIFDPDQEDPDSWLATLG